MKIYGDIYFVSIYYLMTRIDCVFLIPEFYIVWFLSARGCKITNQEIGLALIELKYDRHKHTIFSLFLLQCQNSYGILKSEYGSFSLLCNVAIKRFRIYIYLPNISRFNYLLLLIEYSVWLFNFAAGIEKIKKILFEMWIIQLFRKMFLHFYKSR